MRGRRVGVLSATLAQRILEQDGRVHDVPYPTPVEVYRDLEIGRIDAALQDVPIAAWYITPHPRLKNVGDPVGEGIYAAGIRKDSPVLKEKIDGALVELICSGEMEKIYRQWNMWTKSQKKLKEAAGGKLKLSQQKIPLLKYLPLILHGAVMTVVISCLSMLLAVFVGFVLCVGKTYGPAAVRIPCSAYIEVVRGTPLLIQLYLITVFPIWGSISMRLSPPSWGLDSIMRRTKPLSSSGSLCG